MLWALANEDRIIVGRNDFDVRLAGCPKAAVSWPLIQSPDAIDQPAARPIPE